MSFISNRAHGLDALIHRPRPSSWHEFTRNPCVYIAQKLYIWQSSCPAGSPTGVLPVSVVCVSDTHNRQPPLPEGDVLFHAGDLTQSGTVEEVEAALRWLPSQPHPVKIVIAGNHDLLLDPKQDAKGNRTKTTIDSSKSPETLRALLPWDGIIYLQDQDTIISCPNGRRLRVYGSPYSPRHGNWAFQYPRGEDIWRGRIPGDTDILITHSAPRGHGDLLNLGCLHLLRELWRVRPRLHVFGHVHDGAGMETVRFDALQEAYERTLVAGRVGNVIRMAWSCLRLLFAPKQQGGESQWCTKGMLFNASMVGGLRDDRVREAVKVLI